MDDIYLIRSYSHSQTLQGWSGRTIEISHTRPCYDKKSFFIAAIRLRQAIAIVAVTDFIYILIACFAVNDLPAHVVLITSPHMRIRTVAWYRTIGTPERMIWRFIGLSRSSQKLFQAIQEFISSYRSDFGLFAHWLDIRSLQRIQGTPLLDFVRLALIKTSIAVSSGARRTRMPYLMLAPMFQKSAFAFLCSTIFLKFGRADEVEILTYGFILTLIVFIDIYVHTRILFRQPSLIIDSEFRASTQTMSEEEIASRCHKANDLKTAIMASALVMSPWVSFRLWFALLLFCFASQKDALKDSTIISFTRTVMRNFAFLDDRVVTKKKHYIALGSGSSRYKLKIKMIEAPTVEKWDCTFVAYGSRGDFQSPTYMSKWLIARGYKTRVIFDLDVVQGTRDLNALEKGDSLAGLSGNHFTKQLMMSTRANSSVMFSNNWMGNLVPQLVTCNLTDRRYYQTCILGNSWVDLCTWISYFDADADTDYGITGSCLPYSSDGCTPLGTTYKRGDTLANRSAALIARIVILVFPNYLVPYSVSRACIKSIESWVIRPQYWIYGICRTVVVTGSSIHAEIKCDSPQMWFHINSVHNLRKTTNPPLVDTKAVCGTECLKSSIVMMVY